MKKLLLIGIISMATVQVFAQNRQNLFSSKQYLPVMDVEPVANKIKLDILKPLLYSVESSISSTQSERIQKVADAYGLKTLENLHMEFDLEGCEFLQSDSDIFSCHQTLLTNGVTAKVFGTGIDMSGQKTTNPVLLKTDLTIVSVSKQTDTTVTSTMDTKSAFGNIRFVDQDGDIITHMSFQMRELIDGQQY